MSRFLLGLILFSVLFSFGLNEFADAKGADEPCSYLDKNHYHKYSYDSVKGTASCVKVDYWVPERCGNIAGLYLTDSACQPPKPAEQTSETEQQREQQQREQQPTPQSTPQPTNNKPKPVQDDKSWMLWMTLIGIFFAIVLLGITKSRRGHSRGFGSYDNRPSSRQLGYLSDLGYDGQMPDSSADASDRITDIENGGDGHIDDDR